MKKEILILAALLSPVVAFGINPQYQKFLGLKYRYPSANFEKGKFQSITGKFNGKTTDTLTLFPYDGNWDGDPQTGDDIFYYDQWIIISKNGTVPSKIIRSYYPDLIYEGDLDGNGTDEFGVVLTGQHGNWWEYDSFTLHQGKVKPFIDVTWWAGETEDLRIALKPTGTKGKVKVNYYIMDPDDFKMHTTTKTITKYLK